MFVGCGLGGASLVNANVSLEAYTETRVRHLERRDGRGLVHFELLEADRPAPSRIVAADLVILAAGSLGSTEILLRSAARGLPLSDRVGRRFTGNGDVFAFAYNNDQEIHGIGFGEQPPEGRRAVGPSVTGMIDLRDPARLEDGLILEEGAAPGALAVLVPAALRTAAHTRGYDTDDEPADLANETRRESESLLRGPYYGAVRNSQALLVLGHDDGAVIPRPLGVNPLLTISALAERCCQLLARDRGWDIDYGARMRPVRES